MKTELIKSMNAAIISPASHAPKVSIGMPVYNGDPFIREALDSLLAQTFTDFELLISDNASTDGTEKICREYAAKDARIRYIRQPYNRGAPANFKFVLDESIGEYFMWAAADDRRHPSFLSLSVDILSECSRVGLVFCGTETRDLLSGDGFLSMTGFATTANLSVRAFFRLAHPCPSLIYGLFRTCVIKQCEIQCCDYFDLYLGLWFELNSQIVIIPRCLYVAGTNGTRTPYSLTGKYMNNRGYIRLTDALFQKSLRRLPALFLCMVARYLSNNAVRSHNRLIRSAILEPSNSQ